jgi:hypothetical protein
VVQRLLSRDGHGFILIPRQRRGRCFMSSGFDIPSSEVKKRRIARRSSMAGAFCKGPRQTQETLSPKCTPFACRPTKAVGEDLDRVLRAGRRREPGSGKVYLRSSSSCSLCSEEPSRAARKCWILFSARIVRISDEAPRFFTVLRFFPKSRQSHDSQKSSGGSFHDAAPLSPFVPFCC